MKRFFGPVQIKIIGPKENVHGPMGSPGPAPPREAGPGSWPWPRIPSKCHFEAMFYKGFATFAPSAKVKHATLVNVMLFHVFLIPFCDVALRMLHKRQVL